MEVVHRNIITKNLTHLMDEVNLEDLYPLLIAEGVIGEEDVSRIQNQFPTLSQRACEFFMWYRTRGPLAFSTLIDSLKRSGHESVADVLVSPESPSGGRRHPPPASCISIGHSNGENVNEEEFCSIRPPPQISEIDLLEEEASYLDVVVKPAVLYNNGSTEYESTYEMMLKPRGFALIINNLEFVNEEIGKTRNGAKYDSVHLKKLFEAFDFEVTVRHNVNRQDLEHIFEVFIQKFKVTRVNACFVAVMSHGAEDNILMHDGTYARIWTDIVSRFNNRNCPALMRLPKIFLINACRGDKRDYGVPLQQTNTPPASKAREGKSQTDQGHDDIHPPKEFNEDSEVKDIIVCYSSIPGYVAVRAADAGTWYVWNFCEVFMNNAHNTEFKKMLDMVGRKMKDFCIENKEHQVPSYAVYGFNYDLYFNPGLGAQIVEDEES